MKKKCGRPAGIPAVPAAAVLALCLILYPAIAAWAAPEEPAAGPETEEYREDFMEDLGQEDLEALLSGSEDETISEKELEEMVNQWMQEDISAGAPGSAGKKFAVQDDPDTILEFDAARGEYIYILPDGNEYRMNVPRDAVHAGQVILRVPDGGFIGVMKKNGEAFYQDDTTFTEPGNYEVEYYSGGIDTSGGVNVNRVDSGALGTTRSHIRFRIIPPIWNEGGSLMPPEDFSLPVGALLGEPGYARAETGEGFEAEMLLMEEMDGVFLDLLRQSHTPVALKAVVTEQNKAWTSEALCRELGRDHEAMQKYAAKQPVHHKRRK